jgi:pimeloyl-ACP methyl ester carboxylesterase
LILETRELDGDAPALVFLHEGLGSVALWRDFPERVAAATGRRVFLYSRAGHGQSDLPDGPRTPRFMHEEALDVLPPLLAEHGIERPVLIGHSDGASIALIFAAASGRSLRGAVIEAPHCFVEPITLAGVREMTESAEATDLLERLKRHHRDPEPLFRAWSDTWLEPGFVDWNIEGLLPDIRCPLLLVQGEGDPYGTPEQIHAVAPTETLLLPDCGHTPHRDCAERVLKANTAFIRRTLAGAPLSYAQGRVADAPSPGAAP